MRKLCHSHILPYICMKLVLACAQARETTCPRIIPKSCIKRLPFAGQCCHMQDATRHHVRARIQLGFALQRSEHQHLCLAAMPSGMATPGPLLAVAAKPALTSSKLAQRQIVHLGQDLQRLQCKLAGLCQLRQPQGLHRSDPAGSTIQIFCRDSCYELPCRRPVSIAALQRTNSLASDSVRSLVHL